MVNLLGYRVVLILVCMTLLAVTCGGTVFYYLMPAQEQADNELRNLESKIRSKKAEINRLKFEFEQLKDQIVQFKILKNKGFFNAQDRVTARETINELTDKAGLLKAELSLSAASEVKSTEAESANHVLISGPMNIKFNAMSDVNVFKYIVALQRIFPGYLEFKKMDVTRSSVTGFREKLQQIRKGDGASLLDGSVEFTWWSMASQVQMQPSPYFNPGAITSPATEGVPK